MASKKSTNKSVGAATKLITNGVKAAAQSKAKKTSNSAWINSAKSTAKKKEALTKNKIASAASGAKLGTVSGVLGAAKKASSKTSGAVNLPYKGGAKKTNLPNTGGTPKAEKMPYRTKKKTY